MSGSGAESRDRSPATVDPRPILVLGVNRSGTKWLCNLIGRHPDVAIVAHPDHGGVLESNLLTEYGRSFDFEDPDGYRSFLDFWTRTHFFSIAGGKREDFETEDHPRGPVEAFRMLMNQYARGHGASHWVQKVGPMSTSYVLQRLPEARLIVIQRKMADTVKSRLKLDRNRAIPATALRAALSIAVQLREIEEVCRGLEVFRVRYEDLCDDQDVTLTRIAAFLNLPDEGWHDHGFPRNTSFPTERDRHRAIGFRDLMSIRVATTVVPFIPHAFLKEVRRRLTRAGGGILPGTFRHLEDEGQAA